MCLHRHLEPKLQKMAASFKIVLLEGARQVGKSTLLTHLFPEAKVFVFDPFQDLYGARRHPDLFLNQFEPPLILDEIQFVPELLPALKRKVDHSNKKEQYF
jgi:predicted AAA+ superfamily ATPase